MEDTAQIGKDYRGKILKFVKDAGHQAETVDPTNADTPINKSVGLTEVGAHIISNEESLGEEVAEVAESLVEDVKGPILGRPLVKIADSIRGLGMFLKRKKEQSNPEEEIVEVNKAA